MHAALIRLTILIAGLTLLVNTSAAARMDEEAAAILAEHFSDDGPGAAVAVLRDGELLIEATIGYADIDAGIAIDAATLFDLASVSKQFTAAAILTLEAAGQLDVRQPVSHYLPDFAVESSGRPVRVDDLLHHVSGLADYTSDAWQGSDRAFARLTTQTHLDWLNQQDSPEAPGELYRYNNSGYVLLALIVERVSGQRFAEFARTRLFQPAGMRATRIMDRVDAQFRRQARGYKVEDGEVSPAGFPSSVTGDGNVYSCLDDMVAWMQALDGETVLDARQKRRAWRSGRLDSGAVIADEDGHGYGAGWVIEGNGRVSHSGSWMGTATYLLRDQPAGVSVVVLSNDENADVATIAEALAELVE